MASQRLHPFNTTNPTVETETGSTPVLRAAMSDKPERERIESYRRAKASFVRQPGWQECKPIHDFIKKNYAKRSRKQPVYLDYGGAGQPMKTVLKEEYDLFRRNSLGNPHSANPRYIPSISCIKLDVFLTQVRFG